MTVLVVGSVALDSVETPFGKADDVLGGSGKGRCAGKHQRGGQCARPGSQKQGAARECRGNVHGSFLFRMSHETNKPTATTVIDSIYLII